MSASKRTQRALLALAAAAVLAVLLGFLLPESWEVERTARIDAPAAAVHARLANLAEWSEWAPWPPADAVARWRGPERGVDAAVSWSGPKGSGALLLTACDPELGVWFDLELEGGRVRAKGALRYVPAEEGTRLVASLRGRLGANPAARWLGPFLEWRFARRLERALAALERACEHAR